MKAKDSGYPQHKATAFFPPPPPALPFFLLNIMDEEEVPDLKVYLPFLSLTFQEECH